MSNPTKCIKISVSIQCCKKSCGHCQFKLDGDTMCQIYGWLEPSKMGRAGSALRHKKCLEAEIARTCENCKDCTRCIKPTNRNPRTSTCWRPLK